MARQETPRGAKVAAAVFTATFALPILAMIVFALVAR
jgi:hypothetical protein